MTDRISIWPVVVAGVERSSAHKQVGLVVRPLTKDEAVKKDPEDPTGLRELSGATTAQHSALTAFLYELMRDHVPMGVIQKILLESLPSRGPFKLCNGWLAQYAEFVGTSLFDPYGPRPDSKLVPFAVDNLKEELDGYVIGHTEMCLTTFHVEAFRIIKGGDGKNQLASRDDEVKTYFQQRCREFDVSGFRTVPLSGFPGVYAVFISPFEDRGARP